MRDELAPLTGSEFSPRTHHGFFGRRDGVSTGLYRGLNCGFGSGDEKGNVTENRARVAATMEISPSRLLTVYQTHSATVLTVDQTHTPENAPRADAMVTNKPELGLAILTADCAPVVFADENNSIIGAAHAGWKGAAGGVLENTIEAMEHLGAVRAAIRAVIGPTISQANYEVGPEFKARLLTEDPNHDRFFVPSPKANHSLFDFPSYCAHRLASAGIAHVQNLAECTYADEAAWFSYRRTTHRGEPDYGRNISVIVLAP